MGQPRLHVGGLQAARGLLAGGVDVTVVAHARGRRVGAGEHGQRLLLERTAALAAACTGLPFELEFGAALQCRPGAGGQHGDGRGDHRHAARLARFRFELDHLDHAGLCQRVAGVDARECAVRPRAMHQHGDQRIAQMLVNRVTRLAGDDGMRVDVPGGPADQLVTAGGFHRWRLRGQRDLAGVRGKAAVGGPASVGRDHRAGITAQPVGGNAEPPRGRLQQQPTRQRADLAQVAPCGRDGVAGAAHLAAVGPLRPAIVVADAQPQRNHADALPVGVKLIGDDPRQGRGHAGAGIRIARADQHQAVGVDPHIGAEVVEIVAEQRRRQRRVGGVGQANADHQRTSGAGQHLQESTAVEPDHGVAALAAHDWPALPAAARLIARRTRVWQPQRHRLGNWSMSSSLGLGLRRSSATPAISQPGVQ